MSAKTKALLGCCLGCVCSVIIYFKTHDISILYCMPFFALFGFGYAFSMNILRSWLSSAANVTGEIAMFSLFAQLIAGRGLLPGLLLCMFIFIAVIGFAYLPGIFVGLRELYRESASKKEEDVRAHADDPAQAQAPVGTRPFIPPTASASAPQPVQRQAPTPPAPPPMDTHAEQPKPQANAAPRSRAGMYLGVAALLLCLGGGLFFYFNTEKFVGTWVSDDRTECFKIEKSSLTTYTVEHWTISAFSNKIERGSTTAELDFTKIVINAVVTTVQGEIKNERLIIRSPMQVVFSGLRGSEQALVNTIRARKGATAERTKPSVAAPSPSGAASPEPTGLEGVIARHGIQGNSVFYRGKHYSVHREAKGYDDARAICRSYGGDLAVIENKEHNDILYAMMRLNGYTSAYFGISNKNAVRAWRTVEGNALSYTNWHPGEPNNEGNAEYYGMFYSKYKDGTWNDGAYNMNAHDLEKAFFCATHADYTRSQQPVAVPTALYGTYQGHYLLREKKIKLTLEVEPTAHGGAQAFFDFASFENPQWSGRYAMDVHYDTGSGEYTLTGARWIKRPPRLIFVHLQGTLQNNTLSGRVVGLGTFSVVKKR